MPPAFLVASRLGDMEHCRFATHWLNSEFHYTVCTDVTGRTFGCCLLQMGVDLDGLRPDSIQIDIHLACAHCWASGSSSSLVGPSSTRSLRFTRHIKMPVMTMMTSVAEKISGVRNEL